MITVDQQLLLDRFGRFKTTFGRSNLNKVNLPKTNEENLINSRIIFLTREFYNNIVNVYIIYTGNSHLLIEFKNKKQLKCTSPPCFPRYSNKLNILSRISCSNLYEFL